MTKAARAKQISNLFWAIKPIIIIKGIMRAQGQPDKQDDGQADRQTDKARERER